MRGLRYCSVVHYLALSVSCVAPLYIFCYLHSMSEVLHLSERWSLSLMSRLGSESSHESMIDKKTKTKKEKYLDDEVSNIQILSGDSVRLNAARHVLIPLGQCWDLVSQLGHNTRL